MKKIGEEKYNLPLPQGAIITTKGGDSEFKRIFFVVLNKYTKTSKQSEKAISSLIYNLLKECQRLHLLSIAIPPLGTGVLKIPIEI